MPMCTENLGERRGGKIVRSLNLFDRELLLFFFFSQTVTQIQWHALLKSGMHFLKCSTEDLLDSCEIKIKF